MPEPTDSSVIPIDIQRQRKIDKARIDYENTGAIYRRALIHTLAHLPLQNAAAMWRMMGAYSIEDAAKQADLSVNEAQAIIDESNAMLAESFPSHIKRVF